MVRTNAEKLDMQAQHIGLVHLEQRWIGPKIRLGCKLNDGCDTTTQQS